MGCKQLSPAQLAEILDINRSNLTHLFSGRNKPSLDLATRILHAFPEINTEWLIMGVGAMQKTDAEIVEHEQVKPINSPTELDLFSSVSEIPELEKVQTEESEFSRRKKNAPLSTPRESNNLTPTSNQDEKNDSREVKITEKIVFFYSDKTFEVYHP